MRLVTLTPELAEQVGVQGSRGVLVYEMTRASSAFRAGIRPGDVIVAFNGQSVNEDSQLRKLLADSKIGTTATLDVLRDGRKVQIKVPVTAPTVRSR